MLGELTETEKMQLDMITKFVTENLSAAYKIVDNKLYDGDKIISNFIPVVWYKKVLRNVNTGSENVRIGIGAFCENEVIKGKEYAISEIEKIDFQDDMYSSLYVNILIKGASRILTSIIRHQITHVSEKLELVADRLGFFEHDGKRGYIAGNTCIGKNLPVVHSSKKLCSYELLPNMVKVEYDSKDVEEYVRNYINLNIRVTPVLFTSNILGILKKLYMEAGCPIKFSMYVKGEQSTGKTTAVTYGCSMYNRDEDVEKHLHNLTATEAKLNHILNCESDMVTIIDDLRLSDSKSNMRQQEARLDNLIRVVANNVGKESMTYDYDVNSFVIFIGEYALSNPSTNNRIVMLEFEKVDLDKSKLRKIEQEPLRMSVFYSWFIEWVLDNYDKIVETIRCLNYAYRENRIVKEPYQERLNSHANSLVIAYYIFLMFCQDKNWDMNFDIHNYVCSIQDIIRNQIEELNLEGDYKKSNYIVELYEMIKAYDANIDVGFMRKPTDKVWKNKYYYNSKNDCIYIPSSSIAELLNDMNIKDSVIKVMDYFETAGLLHVDNSKDSVRTKKFKGRRCYVIDYYKWKEYVKNIIEYDKHRTQDDR